MATLPFKDRHEAGRLLGEALAQRWERRGECRAPIVLALPRGGVPVAFEVAQSLDADLDLMLVRKLGTPGQEELAMGAIASGGTRVMNPDIVATLGIDEATITKVIERESRELARRERAYRGDRPAPDLSGRCVILVDDGLATGATMRAAIAAARTRAPAAVVVAVPVAPADTIETLRGEADDVICLATPAPFYAIGHFYRDFPQTSDAEVRELLKRRWHDAASARGRRKEGPP